MSLRKFLGLNDGGPVAPAMPPTGAAIPRPAAPSSGIGLYGKLPTQADFVRVNAGCFASGKFDQWLEDGVGAVLSARGTPSDAVVTFFAYSPAAPNACIGILGPSRDKVGRQFPAALFAYLEPSMTALSAFAADAVGAFLFHAQATVADLPQAQATPALDGLDLPNAEAQQAAAEEARRQLGESNLAETLAGLFGPPLPSVRDHALATCLAACATARGQFPDKTAITLELPAADDRARDFWLALVTAALGWPSGAPSWLWDDKADRLLLALGPGSPNLFVALALPDWAGARHWVIRPQLPLAGAPATLTGQLKVVVDEPTSSVADLWLAASSS